ncbi:MAG TPA: Fe-S cluster assembly protein SufD [Pyrinomonadaceae bacterium]|nr:Fe-S cluster assembly protein SufD [Pyrinomonadaceae bacterium]
MGNLPLARPPQDKMVAEIAHTNVYDAAFRELLRQQSGAPAWLRRAREDAFAEFDRVGFPTVREEEWKYTSTAPIARAAFTPSFGPTRSLNGELRSFTFEEARDSRLVFVNGVFQRESSSVSGLPAGVVVVNLAEAVTQPEYESQLSSHFDGSHDNGFTALNAALFVSGAFLLIPRGVEVTVPIHLLFISETTNGDTPASFPRVHILAEENSSATIVESYAGMTEGRYLTNAVIDVDVKPGARINHYRIQRESADAFHIATTKAKTGRDSAYEITSINLGGLLARHGIEVKLDDEGSHCAVDGLYLIGAEQHSDTHSLIDHRHPHGTSRQLYKGVLDGKSRAVFNGKVFVRHGAQQTDAQQTNKNLLLSDEARVDTKPQLEIFADDVKCAHGAAVGQLSEDELFYLESRGINPALARNMLTYGFAEEVIERIKIDSVRAELNRFVLNRLGTSLDD